MNASERINLIQAVAATFTDWDDAGFVLDEFGVPWAPKDDYRELAKWARERLRGASDEQLLTVADHQRVSVAPRQRDDLARSPWPEGRLRLFVSHTNAHRRNASELKDALAKWGVGAFVAHQDIEPTEVWIETIELALRTCDALCAYLTSDFQSSLWTDQEIGWAYGRGVPVLGVRVASDPYGFIGRFQGIPASAADSSASLAIAIARKLAEDDRTSIKMGVGIVAQFCSSSSFSQTRELYPILSSVKTWTGEMKGQVRQAAQENSQIREAIYGNRPVPEMIDELLGPIA